MRQHRCLISSILLLSLLFGNQSYAQMFRKKQVADTTKQQPKKSDYEKFTTDKECKSTDGLIRMHRVKNKLYFELPVNLLEREMLLGSTVSEISDNANAIIGSKPFEPLHFRFSRADNNICMKIVIQNNISADQNDGIARSLAKSNIDPIIKTFKITHHNTDSTALVFDVTDFFAGDEKRLSPFDPYSANMGQSSSRNESFESDKSFIDEAKGFSDNIVIKSTLSYKYSLTANKSTIAKDAPFTAVMTRSIILLPEQPYRPRITDSRIAIFPTGKMVYDQSEQRAKAVYYANRWRLEPVDSAAYIRGEKVDVKQPIIFYVDNNFPELWKEHIKEGVNQWAEIFEQIGFKDAIRAEDFPMDDPQFDPDNIKYSCVRYAPIRVSNAMGPSWIDPRSGEIINASVYLYHDVIKLVNSWLFVQTSQADKRVRTKNIPQEVMGDALRYVVAHEIGHCLGFMHNMSASANIPVDSLRSPSFTQKYGTTTSIMDYARFNYVAQPGDMERGVKLTPPRFGQYDKFLIKWNYTPLMQAESAEQEYKTTSKWLSEASADPILRYGKQQFETIDPRSQTEDLGDNAIKASQYGIKNLKFILQNLNQWVDSEDADYSYRANIYNEIIFQYFNYVEHVFANVGGVYLYEKHTGDKVPSYVSTPRERQKEAVKFLTQQLSDLDWMDNKQVMQNLTIMGSPADVLREIIMGSLIASPEKVSMSAEKAEKSPYTVKECMDDIFEYIWEPTIKGRKLNATEIKLQKLYLNNIGNGAGLPIGPKKNRGIADDQRFGLPESLVNSAGINRPELCCSAMSGGNHQHTINPVAGYDEPLLNYFISDPFDGIYYGYILKVRDILRNKVSHSDAQTKAHYQLMLHNIEKALQK